MTTADFARLRRLTPVTEETVDDFLAAAAGVADEGGADAVDALLGVLDDTCNLGGVMQSVTLLIGEMEGATVVPRLLAAAVPLHAGARHAFGDIIRVLLSKWDRSLFVLLGQEMRAVRRNSATL